MKRLMVIVLLMAPFNVSLAEEPTPVKESSVTDEKDLGKFNEGPATARDTPQENIAHTCPYTCNEAGYSRGQCREWQEGNNCMIGPKLDAPQQGE